MKVDTISLDQLFEHQLLVDLYLLSMNPRPTHILVMDALRLTFAPIICQELEILTCIKSLLSFEQVSLPVNKSTL